MTKKTLLTPSEAAKLLHVAPTTIRHWAQIGRLPFITTPGGHRRFDKNDILSVLSKSTITTGVKPVFSLLIIDDNKEFVDMLVQLLGSFFPEIKIEFAYNGFDAGDLLHRCKPDLVMLDLMMAGINGFSICQRIKGIPATQHITIIAMTGALTDDNVKRIIELGAETCIGKPLDYDFLKNMIRELIEKKANAA